MYQNVYYDRFNKIMHLWDDSEGHLRFPHEPYAYIEHSSGQYITMSGKRVSKTTRWSPADIDQGIVYEYMVRPETQLLMDTYIDSDEPSTNHCIFTFDIEVAKEGKYSLPEDAHNTITSIAYHDSLSGEYGCLVLDVNCEFDVSNFSDIKVEKFNTERAMLLRFLEIWRSIPMTIVTGWNVLWYDCFYLYNRLERVVKKYAGKRLSPISKVDSYTNRFGRKVFKIGGISILDYMELYKTHTYRELSNYRLDTVAREELGRGKVEYDKDLDHLFKTDPIKFIEYNIEDVRLIVDFEAKLDFIHISIGTCHKGHVPYEDIFLTSRYMEGACLTALHRKGLVAINNKSYSGEKADGAFVKVPKPGLYHWVYDLDLTSLYPFNIMNLNISTETKWGKVTDWSSDDFFNGKDRPYTIEVVDERHSMFGERCTISGLRKFLNDFNLSIAANGIMYTLDYVGFIPELLNTWFGERADFRKIAKEASDNGDEVTYNFYNRKQKIQKVLLNSLYGVLLLPIFRFYDKDNGEAVTLTGQQLIGYTSIVANEFYNNELDGTVNYSVELDDGSLVDMDDVEFTIMILRDNEKTIAKPSELVSGDDVLCIYKNGNIVKSYYEDQIY